MNWTITVEKDRLRRGEALVHKLQVSQQRPPFSIFFNLMKIFWFIIWELFDADWDGEDDQHRFEFPPADSEIRR